MSWIPGVIAALGMLILIVIGAAVLSRINKTETEPESSDEPLGDMIDIKDFLNRWEDSRK